MYHQPSKHKQLLQRIAIYTIMTLSVILLVVVLVFFMRGYRFDTKGGRIEQGGLVQLVSQPSGASVTIDGRSFGSRTTAKTTMNTGEHVISMQRTGYLPWQKTVSVKAGEVLWLNYARLIPKERPVETVADLDTPVSSLVSPNSKWMIIASKKPSENFKLIDLSQNDIEPVSLDLPEELITDSADASKSSLSVTSWDFSNHHVLVRHAYITDNGKKKNEWLVIDTQQPEKSANITTALGIDPSTVVFSSATNRQVYALVNGTVRRIEVESRTMSGPLVSQVESFKVTRKALFYTTLRDAKTGVRSVGYLSGNSVKPRTIRSFTDDGKKQLNIVSGDYFDQTYTAISYGDTIEIMKGELPRSDSSVALSLSLQTTITTPSPVNFLNYRLGGRFIVAQTDNAFIVHDAELAKTTTTPIKGESVQATELHWLDGFHVWSDQGGVLRMYEFDGANQHELMSVAPGFDAALSPSGAYLYAVTADDSGYRLSRVRMILQ